MELNINFVDIEQLWERLRQKVSQTKDPSIPLVEHKQFLSIWQSLQKYCKQQIELERSVIIQNFAKATIQQHLDKDTQEKKILFMLNENFIYQNHLKYRVFFQLKTQGFVQENKQAPIKISYQALKKLSSSSLEAQQIKNLAEAIFKEIQELLTSHSSIEIDLGLFGKLSMYNKTISYQFQQTQKKISSISSKQTVRALVDVRSNLQSSCQTQRLDESKQNLMQSKLYYEEKPTTQAQQFRKLKVSMNTPELQKLMKSDQKDLYSPTRKFEIKDNQIKAELLAAGTDPLAKNQNFSKLASKAQSLIETQFFKPAQATIRFPPMLDVFSRTLAAPLVAQKYSISISGRIGINYRPFAKNLVLDSETKNACFQRIQDSSVNFTANSELLETPATFLEEYRFRLGVKQRDDIYNKIKAKEACYKRYKAYIKNEIPLEFIAPLNNFWISEILNLIPAKLDLVTQLLMEKMIKSMMDEMYNDYCESVKKSIIDYVLKDNEERMRIGIMQTFGQVHDYGENFFKGIEPSDEWKDRANDARDLICQYLVINNKATLKIMKIWEKYEGFSFVVLPNKIDPSMRIIDFINIQERNIQEIQSQLMQNWYKEVAGVLQEELGAMKQTKKQALIFFDACAAIMANSLRNLIHQSLRSYHVFFERFDKSVILTYEEVLERQKDFLNDVEDVFLNIKLKQQEKQIVFEDCLHEMVETSLLKIIDDFSFSQKNFPRAENNIAKGDKTTLWEFPQEDEIYQETVVFISKVLRQSLRFIENAKEIYDKYCFLYLELEKVENWLNSTPRRKEEVLSEINRYKILRNQINEVVPTFIRMNMIEVNGQDIKHDYLEICEQIQDELQSYIHKTLMSKCEQITKDVIVIIEQLRQRADTTEKLVELENLIDKIKKTEFRRLKAELLEAIKWYSSVYQTFFVLEEEDLKKIHQTSLLVINFMENVDREETRICQEREDLEAQLKKTKEQFENNLQDVASSVSFLYAKYTNEHFLEEATQAIQNLAYTLRQYQLEMNSINVKEEQLGWILTEFPLLNQTFFQLKPFEELWTMIKNKKENFAKWYNLSSIFTLEPEEIEKDVKQMIQTIMRLKKTFTDSKNGQKPLELVNSTFKETKEFQQNLPLIHVFSNKGLKERHWSDISDIIGVPISQNKKETLKRITNLVPNNLHQKLEEISDSASKEFAIEKILDKMVEDWQAVEVELKIWKDTGTYVVAGTSVEEVEQLLDDQIVKTLTMRGSPYAKFFEERISKWEDWLSYTQQLFDYWKKVQSVWLYLEPVFTSADIKNNLPKEAKAFERVDQDWRNQIIGEVLKNHNVIQFTQKRKMLDVLKESHLRLEQVQKGLNSYLETKRSKFPRFYFLSNDELLEILSETKDPERVQPYLKKCFEGIQKLCFDSEKIIQGMHSTEGEYVEFTETVNTKNANGNVDEWLLWLEDIVALVRSKITDLDRCTIEALIVLDVHNRDVTVTLAENKVDQINDFNWQAQLRYYFINNEIIVRIINAICQYNYEYLGNSARLVITPLTDRCYRTLCGAIHLNYGGAPEGPAGTGKTETVKDLAKALARQCVVFNCSDGLDYKAMGKFFKGLASSGAWSCFDEFNRIDLEVLSVVAQQILTIQLARTDNLTEFDFEGTRIKLKPTCNVFITMNPGYAGRSELPDNLKALFRSVAMMVPDYAMIAEICLYSYGFNDARNLARKIVTTYKLCSEQLSSQDHYDYGMRAVKSVLTAAGNLKRKFQNENESILMLRAINDVNLAKFLAFDLPLFRGITSDLFPGVQLPEIDYKAMFECIDLQIEQMNIQKVPYLIEKTIQLYEMILVRHGLMVVGLPFAGKTTSIKLLQGALTFLKSRGEMNENKTQITVINPKSISMNQLYGFSDEISHEWTDGVLAVKFRAFAKGEDSDRKWLIFDGPVDAVWIENMNTVLDDNKKLCLNSGEIIAMSRSMNMIFEPMDLAAASPATVSRCGMIYMEPASMGWRPLFYTWKKSLPKTFRPEDYEEIDMLFNWSIDILLSHLRHKFKEISPTQDQNLVQALMRIFRGLLKDFEDEEYYNKIDIKVRHTTIDMKFVFSLYWSIGGSVVTEDRKPFDIFCKRLFNKDIEVEKNIATKKITLPERGTLYEYQYKRKDLESDWVLWIDLIELEEIPQRMRPADILVQTQDTVRYNFLLKHNILIESPILFCGPTGTGKSIYIKNLLLNGLPQNQYMTIQVGFSAQTSASQTMEIIDSRLDKKRKGIFGPKLGKCIIFVDDLNMPSKEKYGAQPPIEILRQFIDQGGWYDLIDKDKSFKNLVDITFVSAMGPPGGGRTFITPRFLRHINTISIANFDDDTLSRIFGTILRWYLTVNQFSPEVIKLENKLVIATLDVYKYAMKELLPTPMKSHYLFNLRDFAKVMFGVCLADKEFINNQEIIVRLWTHECFRVFSDRLVNTTDRETILKYVREVIRKSFNMNFDTIFAHLDNNGDKEVNTLDEIRLLIFTDVLTPPGSVKKPYEEIIDFNKLTKACEEGLENYNIIQSDKPMDLVLFSFAIEHLMIITRMIKQTGGNGLLVGVGGSGRQSLTRLAAQLQDYLTLQIEISKSYGKEEWHEDIKKILKSAGGKGNSTVFLFTDSQIKNEGFVEDINNLLNTYEVPNLFKQEEKAEIMEMVRAASRLEGKASDGTPEQLYSYFVERCKRNLHIVLCFSPIGNSFRNRVRMFPSLVNCCTIDWFFEWPQDALVSVAKKFLFNIQMEPEVKQSCTEMVEYFHMSTIKWAEHFYDNLKRKYYVTPTSYLEMIITFQNLLAEKRKEVTSQIEKYENGYAQIISTEEKVGLMQIQLTEMVPKLKQAAIDTEVQMENCAKEKELADVLAEGIQKESAIVQETVDQATKIKDECNRELSEALPALRESEKALECIGKQEIDFLKKLPAPSNPIKATLKALCLLKYPNPTERKKEGLKTVVDWWAASQKLLGNPRLLQELTEFDKENIEEDTINKLGAYFNDPENKDLLEENAVKNASQVCFSMLLWIKAMYKFYFVNKRVKPKRQASEAANKQVDGLKIQLAAKQEELNKAQKKVEKLNNNLEITKRNKEKLEKDYEECSQQLVRAKKLIESLGGEKGRWKDLAQELKGFYVNLTGDVLVSSGMIAYLGAFTPTYRANIAQEWVEKCQEMKIPGSEKFSLQHVLGEQVKIRAWNIDGLPSDSFSIENAIKIFKSRRWPLCIDPQGQANKWIKRMEAVKKLSVIKLTDSDFLRTLENSIQFGRPVLLENVGEDLDPSLTPILLKQTYQKGPSTYLKLGETAIEYSPDFRFYITTKLRNPHYMPELSTKVVLINFMITQEGLNDQLLGILVKKERPDLEKEKERLIIEGANNKKQLSEIEDKILQVLSGKNNILTDESAINILTASKVTSNEIKEKQIIADQTEIEIDEARQTFQPVSQQASCLFFCISDLGNLDPMYQYSLVYYIDLFTQGIMNSEKSSNFNQRLENLKSYFLYSLYSNICRSLFEKDKLVFSMLLLVRLLEFNKQLNPEHWRFLLTGGMALSDYLPEKPKSSEWLSLKSWGEITRLSEQKNFEDLYKKCQNDEFFNKLKVIYDSPNPHREPLPGSLQKHLTNFEKLLFLRTIRPDKMIPAVQDFIISQLSQKFVEPPPFDLGLIYKDSSSTTPLIFVLSPGSDPFASLNAFAEKQQKKISSISLGQGQGPIAQKMIEEGKLNGDWTVLQNCHLAVTWMTTLEKICEDISPDPDKTDPGFRLWLTSYPSPNFPTAILQAGIKMTNEPPKGLKNNLQGSFLTDPVNKPEFFDACAQGPRFKKLLYGLCFFHAVIQERRNYGPLGWNISYEFNESDLRICVRQLKMFLDEFETTVPFSTLHYLTAECNYGGRVTDDKDRRLICTLLSDYYCEETIEKAGYKFALNDCYKVPDCETHEEFLAFIRETLPIITPPDVFGFHSNAAITKDNNETLQFTESLLACSSSSSQQAGASLEDTLNQLCSAILGEFPLEFDLEKCLEKYPVIYEESMNTVLTQELTRFNKLIRVLRSSLNDILKALKGLILMSPQLEKASKQLFDGKVPDMWMESSYPSLKPLGGYVQDLRARLSFFQHWIDKGAPINFWISGFYFTQSFLTGVLQNYARKYTIPIDEIVFDFEVQKQPIDQKPADGAQIFGLFIEGSKWNYNTMELDESDPKVLFVKCPNILLQPVINTKLEIKPSYDCPVYKTSARRGVLSTTGHSTNFVMWLRLPSSVEQKHWIKRGVALLTQLDD